MGLLLASIVRLIRGLIMQLIVIVIFEIILERWEAPSRVKARNKSALWAKTFEMHVLNFHFKNMFSTSAWLTTFCRKSFLKNIFILAHQGQCRATSSSKFSLLWHLVVLHLQVVFMQYTAMYCGQQTPGLRNERRGRK